MTRWRLRRGGVGEEAGSASNVGEVESAMRRSGLSLPVLVVCTGLGADAGACGVAAELGIWGFGCGCGRGGGFEGRGAGAARK